MTHHGYSDTVAELTPRMRDVLVSAAAAISAEAEVERGVNEARMAAFALIFATALGVGLTVGFATSPWLGIFAGVAAAVGTALLLAVIYRVRAVRRRPEQAFRLSASRF